MSDQNDAIFISYAKQDAEAAARICTALRSAGIEVWFDQNELRGGDAWDAAIRRQIKSCALFIPIISANTQSRDEGYFRLEWKLAIDRSHLMSQDRAFLIPVVIDGTQETDSRIPDRFRDVQWSRLPDGTATPAFVQRMITLLEQAPEVKKAAAAASAEAVAVPAGATAIIAPKARKRSPLLALAAVGLLVVMGVGVWVAQHGWMHAEPVAAYSQADRRMTYGVLPFQAPTDDPHAAQVATATGDQIRSMLEGRKELINVVRANAQQALAADSRIKQLAKELNVHFLVRGNVARAAEGYAVTVVGIDGESERVLATQTVKVGKDEVTPPWPDESYGVVQSLINAGIHVEAKRAREKPVDAQDVRDLSFRASDEWHSQRDQDGRAANVNANALLDRALAMAPDDLYALRTRATVNLCDCVNAWSKNPDEQKAIGAAAMERYLELDPNSVYMLGQKAGLYQLRLRWEESLTIADAMLARTPTNAFALSLKATALLRLGQIKDAHVLVDGLLARDPNDWVNLSTAADLYYMEGDYARSASIAQRAIAQMTTSDLQERVAGGIQLTRIAAEARLGHGSRVRTAREDLATSMPNIKTIDDVKKWLHPSADLADFEPLYDGLRLAGIPNN